MMSNFAAAIAVLAVGAQAVDVEAEGAFGRGPIGFNYGYSAPQVRHGRKDNYQPYGLGFGYKDEVQPTYAHTKQKGYGIYLRPASPKPLIANDGYRVKKRSDPHERVHETIYAKCVLSDPDQESPISGVVSLVQDPKDKTTQIWGSFADLEYGKNELSINALGDLRDGCDSTGGVFNPDVSASGYSRGVHVKAPGALGELDNHYGKAQVDLEADVDLSGTQSIIGRSIVITNTQVDEHYKEKTRKSACCTIGLTSGKPKQVYKPEPEPHYGHGYGYGSYAAPKRSYQPYGYNSYQPRNNYW